MENSLKESVAKGLLMTMLFSNLTAANPVFAQTSLKPKVMEPTSAVESNDTADDKENSASSIDYTVILEPLLDLLTPASHELVYESKEPVEVSSPDGKLVSRVDGYQYYTMKDFEYNAKHAFNDQTEKGGFVISHVSFENNSDKEVYRGNLFNFRFPDYSQFMPTNGFINNEVNNLCLSPADVAVEPGETKSGFIVFYVMPDQVDILEELPVIQMEIPGFSSKDDSSEDLLKSTKVNVSFSDSQDEDIDSRGELLPDKFLADNMGTKKLIKDVQVEDGYVSIEPENVSYGFDHYQVSEFIPNAAYEKSLEEFEDGLVVINVPLKVTNDGWEDGISIRSIYARLILDNLVEVKNNVHFEIEGQLLDSNGQTEASENEVFDSVGISNHVLDVGESGIYYLTFAIDGSLYKRFEGADFTLSASIYDGEHRRLDIANYAIEVNDSNRVE